MGTGRLRDSSANLPGYQTLNSKKLEFPGISCWEKKGVKAWPSHVCGYQGCCPEIYNLSDHLSSG